MNRILSIAGLLLVYLNCNIVDEPKADNGLDRTNPGMIHNRGLLVNEESNFRFTFHEDSINSSTQDSTTSHTINVGDWYDEQIGLRTLKFSFQLFYPKNLTTRSRILTFKLYYKSIPKEKKYSIVGIDPSNASSYQITEEQIETFLIYYEAFREDQYIIPNEVDSGEVEILEISSKHIKVAFEVFFTSDQGVEKITGEFTKVY